MATFFDEDPENIDDLIGVSSYLADEPVSAEYAENLRGRMSDIAEEYAEQKRLEALSDEEREAEEESKVEQEKQEDEDHTLSLIHIWRRRDILTIAFARLPWPVCVLPLSRLRLG